MNIHKFPLTGDITLAPAGKVVLVAHQEGSLPTLWIEHDPCHTRMIGYHIVPTGGVILGPSWEHVGSCICGPFVWHVYRAAQ